MQYSLTCTRAISRRNLSALRPALSSFSSISASRVFLHPPRRASSSISSPSSSSQHDLFNYTSGNWLVNNELRLAERKHEFNEHELRRLAAQSVNRTLEDVATLEKLDEGGCNRVFLVTMHDGFQMIARVPYPVTQPKFYAVASEVATMTFLRAHGLPVPKVYGYSPTADNAAKTEYIFMEFVKGTKLSDIIMQLKEVDLAAVLRQVIKLESRIMSIPFEASGSLYHVEDLKGVADEKICSPFWLDGKHFCIGPDVRFHMWYGRRSQLDVNRGPYQSTKEVLAAAALKEIAYLERFGRPLLPFQRARREAYEFKEQSPLDHIENLQRYLLMFPFLIPNDPSLQAFCIRHPDLQPSNIMVSTSAESGQLEIVSLIDWQHACILPRFLAAGIPHRLQNYGDPISDYLVPPSLPSNVNEMKGYELAKAIGVHYARLVHFHYAKGTEELNKLHHDALKDTVSLFARRLFSHAGNPWEGETHELKVLLVEAAEKWEMLTGAGVPCPIEFDPDDVSKMKAFSKRLELPDETMASLQTMIGFGAETWVPADEYKTAKDDAEQLKQRVLTDLGEGGDRENAQAHWIFDDMDEKDYS